MCHDKNECCSIDKLSLTFPSSLEGMNYTIARDEMPQPCIVHAAASPTSSAAGACMTAVRSDVCSDDRLFKTDNEGGNTSMDPVSAVGLAIGAGGIAFQILGGCIKGFVLLSSIQGFGRDSATYLCMLNLQELQLVEWASRAGLLTKPPRLDPRLSEPIVCAVLRELQSLLMDTSKLKSRYRMTYSDMPPSSGTQTQPDYSKEATSLFQDAISNELRSDIMSRAGAIESNAKWPKRVWWAAVDKSRFQELVENIRIFTTELWRLLDPIRQDDMSQSLQIVLSHVIGMTESLDNMQALQQALLQSNFSTGINYGGSALASVAGLKLQGMQLPSSPNTAVGVSVDIRSVDGTIDTSLDGASDALQACQLDIDIHAVTDFVFLKNDETTGTAIYNSVPVLVERKTLPSFAKAKLFQRAQDLALLLSAPKDPSFCSLRCCALASDSSKIKIAFIFTLPPSPPITPLPSPSSPPLISLRNVFSLRPSVTARISLALKLVQSLRWFHAANWLHKDIRSEHILFPSTESGPDLSNPIIVGFAFARADSPAAISEQPSSDWQRDLHRHPDAMGEPTVAFTKDKDIYSLATVLVEIGEWRSLKSILGGLMDTRRYDVSLIELSKVKPWLQDQGAEGLSFRMGEVYSEVIRMMLANEMPEHLRDGEGIREAGILDTAVRELGRCTV